MSVVECLKQMISFDTTNPPGNEGALSDWIAQLLSGFGFSIEQPDCGENRKSLVARLSMGEGPKLVLNGHLDVVPAGDGWDTDPFVAEIKDGKLYGRGSADMKGGVAAMIEAGINIAQQHETLCGELELIFVADEEIVNLGAHSCKYAWCNADYVVIGEPTEMQIQIAHKGTVRFEIEIAGKSCHSSMPWEGINAIEKAAKVIQAVQAYDDQLKTVMHPLLSRPSIAVTTIQGGEKDNIIPGSCVICVDYRMIPGDTAQKVEKRLHEIFTDIQAQDCQFSYQIRRYINLEPGEIEIEHPLVNRAGQVFQETFDQQPVVKDFPATCEQVLFAKEGIPAIIVGPGSIEQAHIANEFVSVCQLEQAVLYYEALARSLLMRDGERI